MPRNNASKPKLAPTLSASARKRTPPVFPGGPAGANADLAEYIGDLLEELEQLATSIDEPTLSYLLAMARAEAEMISLKSRRN